VPDLIRAYSAIEQYTLIHPEQRRFAATADAGYDFDDVRITQFLDFVEVYRIFYHNEYISYIVIRINITLQRTQDF
jgi:hypothetical protein